MSAESDSYSRVDYRRLIAWPRRIEREGPLLEKVLSSGPSKRLLDLGCGSGEHSRFLASLGFQVVGIDSSPSMIVRARELPPAPGLTFIEGDIRRVDTLLEGSFGGALCLGNTLPHLRAPEDLAHLFFGLRRRLSAGAPLLLQILNYERIFLRGERYLPLNFRCEGDEEIVFLRLMEPLDDGDVLFYPSTLRLVAEADPPLRVESSQRVRLRGWRPAELEAVLDEAGFEDRTLHGGFDERPFEALDSTDLIVLAR
jgi:SAM-dependent methyltransferase